MRVHGEYDFYQALSDAGGASAPIALHLEMEGPRALEPALPEQRRVLQVYLHFGEAARSQVGRLALDLQAHHTILHRVVPNEPIPAFDIAVHDGAQVLLRTHVQHVWVPHLVRPSRGVEQVESPPPRLGTLGAVEPVPRDPSPHEAKEQAQVIGVALARHASESCPARPGTYSRREL